MLNFGGDMYDIETNPECFNYFHSVFGTNIIVCKQPELKLSCREFCCQGNTWKVNKMEGDGGLAYLHGPRYWFIIIMTRFNWFCSTRYNIFISGFWLNHTQCRAYGHQTDTSPKISFSIILEKQIPKECRTSKRGNIWRTLCFGSRQHFHTSFSTKTTSYC